jgi:hypothetical protein
LERLFKDNFPVKRVNGESFKPKVNLIRYADDFIITGATKDVLENEVRPLVEQFLQDRGLQLSPEKSCITPRAPRRRTVAATGFLLRWVDSASTHASALHPPRLPVRTGYRSP